ncbi:D-alanyl-D-alanine carboxypeptidase [Candidatus Syntrophocurvum alkaliphilum]|uniref:serine-type D-Ala-D-Ala carboxypeptidase n=1 Tax=Candidatus Syntrophocurvum alkaliphilum TaxID=2293317 RepID=A0A6I6D784_9FIRM|nr:D-alanyl-D-alanine carboxypeptidase family protein [Candidatus Syntrophocurvum alkaliphilum]QGT98993.1 D-alanyl-D-alanine carboxypeptidase [Candidatus Syntrophocurvum alkaliphilum]
MNKRRNLALMVLLIFLFSILAPSALVANDNLNVEAESYILMDADSGKVLLAKNEHQKLAPASMTKLMTLVLALEAVVEGKVTLQEKVVTSENAWRMGGSQIYLEPGEEMTFEDMVIAISAGSANDACVAVAEHLEGTHQDFVDKMNERAKDLGMKNTHFVNSYGLPGDNHLTTSYDMAILARYAITVPRMLSYTSIKEYNLRQGDFKLFNTNKLLWWYDGADGFKTGWTNEAKYCLVSTAKRDGLRLIAVVMASPEPRGNFRDSMQLFNYGFAKYSYKTFFSKGSICGVVNVGKGLEDRIEVIADQDVGSIYQKGEDEKITYQKDLIDYIDAPVREGQKLGEISIFKDGKLQKKVDLNAYKSVERSGVIKQIIKMLGETFLL